MCVCVWSENFRSHPKFESQLYLNSNPKDGLLNLLSSIFTSKKYRLIDHRFAVMIKESNTYRKFSMAAEWVKLLSCVRLFATPWTIAYQAPHCMGFSRQEYWSGLPFPSWGNLPDLVIEPSLNHLSHQGSPPAWQLVYNNHLRIGSCYLDPEDPKPFAQDNRRMF